MSSVGTEYPKEQERVRNAVARAREIAAEHPNLKTGLTFYITMGEDLLRRADEAMASGDVIRIIKHYHELRDWSE